MDRRAGAKKKARMEKVVEGGNIGLEHGRLLRSIMGRHGRMASTMRKKQPAAVLSYPATMQLAKR